MSEDVKTRILEAAKSLFAKQGYAATTVRQICEEAGANVALVSYHYGGKEKLFLTILEAGLPTAEYFSMIDQIQDPLRRIKVFIADFIRFTVENEQLAQIMTHEITMQTDRSEIVRPYTFPVWQRLRTAIEEGREQGRLHYESLDQAQLHVMGTLVFPAHNKQYLASLLSAPLMRPPAIEQEIRERTRYILLGLGAHPREMEEGHA